MSEFPPDIGQIQIIAAFAGLAAMLIWESAHPFFELFRSGRKERGTHVVRNLLIGGVNALLIAVGFAGLWIMAAAWAEQSGVGLLNWLGLPMGARVVGAVLLLDGWTYLWHRLNHVIPFFWRFHRVHHSDSKMDVTTASRFHVGEIFFSSLLACHSSCFSASTSGNCCSTRR